MIYRFALIGGYVKEKQSIHIMFLILSFSLTFESLEHSSGLDTNFAHQSFVRSSHERLSASRIAMSSNLLKFSTWTRFKERSNVAWHDTSNISSIQLCICSTYVIKHEFKLRGGSNKMPGLENESSWSDGVKTNFDRIDPSTDDFNSSKSRSMTAEELASFLPSLDSMLRYNFHIVF